MKFRIIASIIILLIVIVCGFIALSNHQSEDQTPTTGEFQFPQ